MTFQKICGLIGEFSLENERLQAENVELKAQKNKAIEAIEKKYIEWRGYDYDECRAMVSEFDTCTADSFAGGGGASVGIEFATGKAVDVAINHDIRAIQMHKQNHPYTKHYCENVFDVNPIEAVQGRPVGLFWLSPDCTHFSRAKGGKPVKKEIRGLAWIAAKWAEAVKPRIIMLENVEEFQTWGPIDDNGQPIKERRGETFNEFVNTLKGLGYAVEWKVLKACDYGTPTIRKRFFMIARCDGKPIVFPEPTHGKGLLPYRTAAEIIDWSIPCKSIFDRKKPLSENTMRRIARGLKKFVFDNPKPFIVKLDHTTSGSFGQSIENPLNTITTKNGYGSVVPVIANTHFNNTGDSPNAPMSTITAVNNHELITPVLIQTGYGENKAANQKPRILDLHKPLNTIPSTCKAALVTPVICQFNTETTKDGVRAYSLENSIGTITSGGNRFGLCTAFLAKHFGGNYNGAGSDMNEPLHTVTAQDHNAVCTASFIERQFGTSTGHRTDEPLGTITNTDKSRLVQAFLIKYFSGGGVQGQSLNEPLHTVTTKDRFGIVTVEGIDYQIVDIGMRMLEPHELFAAQGFPADYKIAFDVDGKPYPKSEQIARCGNSVCPQVVTALVRANLPDLCCVTKISSMQELTKAVANA